MGIDINDINITLLFIFYFEIKKENNYLNGVKIYNDKKINFFYFQIIINILLNMIKVIFQ